MARKHRKAREVEYPPGQRRGSEEKICFIISRIGRQGTKEHKHFLEVLEYMIRPAVVSAGYGLQVVRADEINRAGSFIKDILESLFSSFVVIADLTGQHPNVFYELGVRHALRPRTILIAQSLDDIPSDLREYRTIEYETSAKGAAVFSKRLKEFLDEIHKEPERADNPVLDRIGSIIENKIAALESERQQLKNDLSDVLKTGKIKATPTDRRIAHRLERIMQFIKAEWQLLDLRWSVKDKNYLLPARQGNFRLFLVRSEEDAREFWYIATHYGPFDSNEELADVSLLMELCSRQGAVPCKFILATGDDLGAEVKEQIERIFQKIKSMGNLREPFSLHIWDATGILDVERELGLKVD